MKIEPAEFTVTIAHRDSEQQWSKAQIEKLEAQCASQPLPTTESKSQSVTAAIRKLLDEREAKGIATYGRSLETHNGRDAVRDLVEELIDGAQYALQWEIERQDMIVELDRLKRRESDLEVCVEYELAENSRLQQAHADLSGALAYERSKSDRLRAERDNALEAVRQIRGSA